MSIPSLYKAKRIYRIGDGVAYEDGNGGIHTGKITTAIKIRGVWRWRITWDGRSHEDPTQYINGSVSMKELNCVAQLYTKLFPSRD